MNPEIDKARNRLDQCIRHLLTAGEHFDTKDYNGYYQGWKIKLEHSKFLVVCKERVADAKKKLEDLERKFYRKKNKG